MTTPFLSVISRLAAVLFLGGSLLLAGCGKGPTDADKSGAKAATPAKSTATKALIETNKGEIEIEFLTADSPKSVENFRILTERGYYNGLTFHRVIKGFMIQGGDPAGDGTGGDSAWGGKFDEEIKATSPLYRRNYVRGVVAMANMSRPNTMGSQFFIMHKDYGLPPNYVIFAQVIRGQEVVDAIAETPTKRGLDGQMSSPLEPMVMKKVTLKP